MDYLTRGEDGLMTLNELYNLFDQAIKQTGGQYIDLSQALVDPLKDVLSPLELDTLRVTSPKLGRTPYDSNCFTRLCLK